METDFGAAEFKAGRGAYQLLLDPRFGQVQREVIERLLSSVAPPGSGVWVASSGTTRKAGEGFQFLALSEEALAASAAAVNAHLEASSRDVFVSCLPDFHVGGFSLQVRAKLVDAAFVRASGNVRPWNGAEFTAEVERAGGTIVSLVPTHVVDLVRAQLRAPQSVRAAVVGGGALSESEYRAARALGWPLLPSFGFTECASQAATAELKSLQSDGDSKLPPLRVLRHIEARVAQGVLEVRSPALFSRRAVIAGGAVTVEERTPSDWHRTSDRVEIHAGMLYPLGRSDDLIKIGGEGVNLAELSLVVRDIRAQRSESGDAALQAADDARLGKSLVLLTTDSALGEAIQSEFNSRVLPFARIRAVRVVEAIERTALGKVKTSAGGKP